MRRFARFAVLSLSAGLAAITAGSELPAFSLVDVVDGKRVSIEPADGHVKVVVFTSATCADAQAFEARIVEVARKFRQAGISTYLLDANAASADGKEYPFAFLKDEGGRVARAWGVDVVPHAVALDGTGAIRYRGFIDDSSDPKKRDLTALTDAVGALLNGRDVRTPETKAYGCRVE